MKIKKSAPVVFLFMTVLALASAGCGRPAGTRRETIAARPPMGWNSYDAYDWRVSETEFKANADFLAERLRPYGWEYAVLDFLWFRHDPQGGLPYRQRQKGLPIKMKYSGDGTPLEPLAMDGFGRLLPDELRFPSAAGGLGFKPLADYVHSRGLKFGIHIMRGVPRPAVLKRLPIKGSRYTCADIADPGDTCSWQNTMYGVDPDKPGAQDYYDSLFELYARWGVDFVKADDTMSPVFHEKEIGMISRAAGKCGRPIVLSLSLGEVSQARAAFLRANANMWRISDDFWDEWPYLERVFDLLNAWSMSAGPGHWPDADMLPVGHLSLNDQPVGQERMSRFTGPELRTLFTLWSIGRSPLMIGSDLPTMPPGLMEFLTNREVLEVDQNSTGNRLVYKDGYGTIIWMASAPGSPGLYLALFNLRAEESDIAFNFQWERLTGAWKVRDLWKHEDLGVFEKSFGSRLPGHGAGLFLLAPAAGKRPVA